MRAETNKWIIPAENSSPAQLRRCGSYATGAILLMALLLLLAVTGFAQGISGELTGTVLDPSGASVNGATVEVVNVASGQRITTTTKNLGEYRLSQLPVGTYTLIVSAPHFVTTELHNIPVELNKTGTANVQLKVGDVTTTVEVSGTAPPVDTTTAQLQATFTDAFSQDLSITSAGGTGAGVLNLSLLSPGVTQSSAMGLGSGPSVGGLRPYDNNFTVEGVDNNNKGTTGALITVPNDAVEQFVLLTNQFSPEFGHSSGGQFNTTVKSGTNSFHGSVYEYFRNRNLNAVDNFYVLQGLTSNPRFDSNRYGGTFGGPIVKNKLFFFTDFERQGVGLTGTSGATVLTPTTAGLAAIAPDPNLSQSNFGVFKKFVPVAPAQASSGTSNPCVAGVNAIAFNNNSSFTPPAAGTCPAGSGLIPIGPVSIAAPAFQNYENFVQSVDYNLSERDQIRGRYIYNKLDQIDTQANLPVFYQIQPFRWHLFTISEYHDFTPSIINEFRVGYNRYFFITPAGSATFPGLNVFPNITLFDLGGGVNIGWDPNAPQGGTQNLYQAIDNISWNKGAHNLKFGAEFREYIAPSNFTQRQFGDYKYNSTQLFLEDFSPDNFGERSSGSSVYYGNDSAIYWYANDTWRVRPNLSVNLGIRYEFTTIPEGEKRQALNSISNTPGVTVSAVNEPLLFNAPRPPKNNWAPRVGFAYSPGTSGNTSIRGGFGIAYDILYDNIGQLAVPPQVGATFDTSLPVKPGFFAGGALPGGGSGTQVLDGPTARTRTSNWIPNQQKWPYSLQWNLGVQHSFAKNYTAEVRYLGTRAVHLDVQDRINKQALVTNTPETATTGFLPTYLQAPSQATLDALPLTLCTPDPTNTFCTSGLQSGSNIIPAFANTGFTSTITADLPLGWSRYHGLQTSLTRRMSHGMTFQAAYTYSRTIDNSTADFHSTDLTPRRPQDFQNWAAEGAVSALSRTHRLTFAMIYDLPFFKNSNWLMKNVVGNWEFAPIYTYESPEWATVQSTTDSNLNGDPAGDRAILNPGGTSGTGSDVTPLLNSAGNTVAYLANTPSARYIKAGPGALADVSRNTLATRPTNDVSMGVYKDVAIRERMKFRLGAQFANIFNHAQFIPGSNPAQGLGVNDVNGFLSVGSNYQSYLTPGNPNFNKPSTVFASNARSIAIVAKFIF